MHQYTVKDFFGNNSNFILYGTKVIAPFLAGLYAATVTDNGLYAGGGVLISVMQTIYDFSRKI